MNKLLTCASAAMALVMILTIGLSTVRNTYFGLRDSIRKDSAAHVQSQIADGLKQLGVQPGDKVAFIGRALDFAINWARLARVQIIAEMPKDAHNFWAGEGMLTSQVVRALAETGASIVVTDALPSQVSRLGWQQIAATSNYAYWLPPRDSADRAPMPLSE
jgi:hypothetical protein